MLLKYSHNLRIIQNQMRFVKGKWLSVIYIPKKNYFRETTNLFTMQIIIPVLLICPLQINKICMCWVCLEDTWLCYQSYIIQLLGDRCVLVNLTKKMYAFQITGSSLHYLYLRKTTRSQAVSREELPTVSCFSICICVSFSLKPNLTL